MTNKNHKLIMALVFVFIISFSASVRFGNALLGNTQYSEETTEDGYERELKIEVYNDSVEITSSRETEDTEDVFELELDVGGLSGESIEFEIEYSSETNTTEIETDLKVTLYELIEFLDTDEDGLYSQDNDTMLQIYSFTEFNPIEYSTMNTSENDLVHVLEVSTSDDVFLIRIYVVDDFTLIEGNLITPSQIKFDIIITNFTFIDDGSLLALRIDLDTKTDYEYETVEETEDVAMGRADEELGIQISKEGKAAFFSWEQTAVVDGVTTSVLSSSNIDLDEDEDGFEAEHKIYLIYQQGASIVHDPKIGITELSGSSESSQISGYMALPAIFLISLMGIIYIKKMKKIEV